MLTIRELSAHADRIEAGAHIFTKSFSVTLRPETPPMMPIVMRAVCAAAGGIPTVRYELHGASLIYRSMVYEMCSADGVSRRAWRIPPFVGDADRAEIFFDIPEGCTLRLMNFAADQDASRIPWQGGMRLNAHLGFYGLCPNNTMPAFELAAECGYPACIVVPKETKDGVIVCIHDDTINRTARDANGNPPVCPMYVWDMTLAELRCWEYGSYKHEIWRGTEIPTLEAFFALCAKTGMRPMFSTHPDLSDAGWLQVKELLTRYGLTKHFHVKSFGADCLAHAWRMLGDTIEGYTYDIGTKTLDIPANLAVLAGTGIDRSRVRVGIEIPEKEMTGERAAAIRTGGCFASVWNVGRIDGARYRALAAMGVTEVTDDFNCSAGLCW